jgi:hypothetical protein
VVASVMGSGAGEVGPALDGPEMEKAPT